MLVQYGLITAKNCCQDFVRQFNTRATLVASSEVKHQQLDEMTTADSGYSTSTLVVIVTFYLMNFVIIIVIGSIVFLTIKNVYCKLVVLGCCCLNLLLFQN